MSYYYKYQFVSPEPLFATVKEELKSYFDTGAVDDLMFPTYLDKCLRKLGKATYVIKEDVLHIEDFQARLPDNFYAVREAWLCTEIDGYPYRSANSFYSQAASQDTIQVSPVISGDKPCNNPDCVDPNCNGAECMPLLIQAVYKTNNEVNVKYTKQYLLNPGNISTKSNCSLDCINYGSSAADSFDIRDNKFTTNFRKGTVYLVFYATEYDEENGIQLVPDNFRIREYIEAYLKYKVFETLSNQVMDETFNQLQQKMMYYKQAADEAYIMAETEIKKQDVNTKMRRLKQQLNKFSMYRMPNSIERYGWRRNGPR
jgi:hypothetical protein